MLETFGKNTFFYRHAVIFNSHTICQGRTTFHKNTQQQLSSGNRDLWPLTTKQFHWHTAMTGALFHSKLQHASSRDFDAEVVCRSDFFFFSLKLQKHFSLSPFLKVDDTHLANHLVKTWNSRFTHYRNQKSQNGRQDSLIFNFQKGGVNGKTQLRMWFHILSVMSGNSKQQEHI